MLVCPAFYENEKCSIKLPDFGFLRAAFGFTFGTKFNEKRAFTSIEGTKRLAKNYSL
jgi:hypothetical protein